MVLLGYTKYVSFSFDLQTFSPIELLKGKLEVTHDQLAATNEHLGATIKNFTCFYMQVCKAAKIEAVVA